MFIICLISLRHEQTSTGMVDGCMGAWVHGAWCIVHIVVHGACSSAWCMPNCQDAWRMPMYMVHIILCLGGWCLFWCMVQAQVWVHGAWLGAWRNSKTWLLLLQVRWEATEWRTQRTGPPRQSAPDIRMLTGRRPVSAGDPWTWTISPRRRKMRMLITPSITLTRKRLSSGGGDLQQLDRRDRSAGWPGKFSRTSRMGDLWVGAVVVPTRSSASIRSLTIASKTTDIARYWSISITRHMWAARWPPATEECWAERGAPRIKRCQIPWRLEHPSNSLWRRSLRRCFTFSMTKLRNRPTNGKSRSRISRQAGSSRLHLCTASRVTTKMWTRGARLSRSCWRLSRSCKTRMKKLRGWRKRGKCWKVMRSTEGL